MGAVDWLRSRCTGTSICPSAERRARQRAEDAAEATAAEISRAGEAIPNQQRGAPQTVAVQTELSEQMVQEIIMNYWRYLDSRGIDQGELPLQYIIGSRSGLRSSAAALPHSEADRAEDDEGGEAEEHGGGVTGYDDECCYNSELENGGGVIGCDDECCYDSELERYLLEQEEKENKEKIKKKRRTPVHGLVRLPRSTLLTQQHPLGLGPFGRNPRRS